MQQIAQLFLILLMGYAVVKTGLLKASDSKFTNGKGRGYNVQNLLKKNGIDFEHFAFMGFVFWKKCSMPSF